jgi:SAM-dependent methyltransferase
MRDRSVREKAFHDSFFGQTNNPRKELTKYYLATLRSRIFFWDAVVRYCANKDVLILGCGVELPDTRVLGTCKSATFLDISSVAMARVREMMSNRNGNFRYVVDDANTLTKIEDASISLIVCVGVLHHLNLQHATLAIRRILAPGGILLAYEPLGGNPAINLYRRLTPKLRSADERPLSRVDIGLISSTFDGGIKTTRFHVIGYLAGLFAHFRIFFAVRRATDWLDKTIFERVPFLSKGAWICVVEAKKGIAPFVKAESFNS